FSGTLTGNADFFGTSASVFNSLQFKLALPTGISCSSCTSDQLLHLQDQYNQYYIQYVRMFDVYQKLMVFNNVTIGQSAHGRPGGSYFTRDWINELYTAYIGAPADFSHVVIPAAPTLSSAYYNGSGYSVGLDFSTGVATARGNDYASQWLAY